MARQKIGTMCRQVAESMETDAAEKNANQAWGALGSFEGSSAAELIISWAGVVCVAEFAGVL